MTAAIKVRARTVAGVIGLLVLGAGAMQVASAGAPMGSDVVVRYSDLDLATRTGAETLYGRIQLAAAQVCRLSDAKDLTQRQGARRCLGELVSHTVASVHSPQLAAVYESHHSDHRPV